MNSLSSAGVRLKLTCLIAMSVVSPLFNCRQCSFRSLSWRELTRHRFETHSNEPNFFEKCAVIGCSQTFRRYSSFLSHLSRKHRGLDMESAARRSIVMSDPTREAEEDHVVTADHADTSQSADIFSGDLQEGTYVATYSVSF